MDSVHVALFATGLVIGALALYILLQAFPGALNAPGGRLKKDSVRRILLPIGSDAPSEETVRAACAMAHAHRALLYGVSVVEVPMALSEGALLDEETHEALQAMDQTSRMVRGFGCQLIPLHEKSRSAAQRVIELAREMEADAIIWEGHIEPGVEPFFGSSAEYVIEESPTFVMLTARRTAQNE